MSLEKYVMENILKPIIHSDKEGEYIFEEDYAKLTLSYNEKKFIDDMLKKYNIALRKKMIIRNDRPSTVKDYEYGKLEASGNIARDIPVKADIEYNEYDNLVFENYDKLDEFLDHTFIPDHVTLKKKVGSHDDKLYPFIKLSSIVKLRLSELENKHILEYLQANGITVRGKDSSIDGEFENYDYYQTYKKSILPKAILGKEQEELFKLFKLTKDPVIREQLIIGNMRLAAYVAYKMNASFGFDINELQSYAYEGLIEAIDKFNPNREYKFSTYAYTYIRGYILNGIAELEGMNKKYWTKGFLSAKREVEETTGLSLANNSKLAEDIINIMLSNGTITKVAAKDFYKLILIVYCKETLEENEEQLIYENSMPETIVINRELKERIEEALDTLTPREKIILELRFGLNGDEPKTLEEVAKEFNVRGERIRQIEVKALRKMRHPKRSREIRQYTDLYPDYTYSPKNNEPQKTYLDEIIAKHTVPKKH